VSDEPDDNPGVLIFPPLLFVLCVAVGFAAYLVRPSRFGLALGFRGLGVVVVLAAVALALWGRQTMRAAGTNIRPDLPATAIVSAGPFARTRNPLYLSLVAIYAGIGIMLASKTFLVFLVPLALVLHFGVVLREERYLDAKFGDVYRAYKSRVRRWV
jgi:protein-S-isoprenylcysteine O-methyltransferase Ste14